MRLCAGRLHRPLITGGKAAAFRTGILYPRHSRDCGNPPAQSAGIIAQAIIAAFLPFARSANHLAKQDGKMRLCAGRLRRPLITGGKAAATLNCR